MSKLRRICYNCGFTDAYPYNVNTASKEKLIDLFCTYKAMKSFTPADNTR